MKDLFIILVIGAIIFGISKIETVPKTNPTSAGTNITQKNSYKNKVSDTKTVNASKQELDALAMNILVAAENRNNAEVQSNYRKMVALGIMEFTQPEVHAKRTPTCPPIRMELNGNQLSGDLCARMGYKLNGKLQEVGYCK